MVAGICFIIFGSGYVFLLYAGTTGMLKKEDLLDIMISDILIGLLGSVISLIQE